VIDEYFANPKANADSWDEDGFFKTGDIMYCDRQTKKWYIVDRKKVTNTSAAHKFRVNLLI
jgi:long-subunit acyl-CoA synthetase (AMP-forming)